MLRRKDAEGYRADVVAFLEELLYNMEGRGFCIESVGNLGCEADREIYLLHRRNLDGDQGEWDWLPTLVWKW
jgi:hypothetical protein